MEGLLAALKFMKKHERSPSSMEKVHGRSPSGTNSRNFTKASRSHGKLTNVDGSLLVAGKVDRSSLKDLLPPERGTAMMVGHPAAQKFDGR